MPPQTRSSYRKPSSRFGRFVSAAANTASSIASSRLARDIANAVSKEVVSYASQSVSSGTKRAVSAASQKASRVFTSRKRARFGGGYGKSKYRTTGRAGPKFTKKGTSKLSKFLKGGFCSKVEAGATLTDADCVYVGHYSLPVNVVVPAVFYALARKIMLSNSFYPTDPLQTSGMSALNIYLRYRTTFNGAVATAGPRLVAANSSVVDLGNALGSLLLTVVPGVVYFELVNIQIYENTSGDLLFDANADGISVEVDCVSNFQLQNRTLASGAGDESSSLDISNNPLRGKIYHGSANIHPYRHNNDVTTTCPALIHDNPSGLLYVGANDATFTSEMSRAMKKPPPRSAFGNVSRNAYVQLAPGEIRRSKVRSHFFINFNNFIKMYLDCMRGASDIYALDEALVRKGPSVIIGLEKLCDSGSESADISVGFEVSVSMNALVSIKRKSAMNPYVLT